MRGLAYGGLSPRRAGGAGEGGKEFEGGSEVSHNFPGYSYGFSAAKYNESILDFC